MTVPVHSIGLRALLLFCGVGAAILAVALLGLWDRAAGAAGIMAALFIVYGLLVARNTERARRRDDADALEDVRYQVVQCVNMAEAIVELVDESREGEALGALPHLSGKASLLVTRYRRYLLPDTVLAIKETEEMIVDAQVRGTADLRGFAVAIDRRFRAIRGGIRGIDDPLLYMARRAI